MTNTDTIRAKVQKHITDNGFELKTSPTTHSCGITPGWIAGVVTDNYLLDGATFVAVYPDHVIYYGMRTPYYHNDWHPLRREGYDSPEGLLTVLAGMCRRPTGCWS